MQRRTGKETYDDDYLYEREHPMSPFLRFSSLVSHCIGNLNSGHSGVLLAINVAQAPSRPNLPFDLQF